MSKRPIEDVETGANPVDKVTKKKTKKEKKSKDAPAPEVAEVVVSEEKEEKKEKKEKKDKKEKKEKKEKKSKTPSTETTPATETGEPKLSKEERKAAKKAAKAAAASAAPVVAAAAVPLLKALTATSTEGYTQSDSLTAIPEATIQEYLKEHSITIDDPNKSNLRPVTEFSHLPPNAFDFTAFKTPSPIQAATWPFTLSGYDCIGVAETGSGKTLAFSVPAIRNIIAALKKVGNAKQLGVRVVCVSPTRELAMQIFEVVEKYSKEAGLLAVCVYGGVPKEEQRMKLKRAQVVVATPGRLNDLINEGSADISKAQFVVLDEADRMLDKGFEEDIKRIIGSCSPTNRQTLMFTATWPQSIRDLASQFMTNPVRVTIGHTTELRANIRIAQTVEVIDQRAKEQRLLQLIKQYQSGADSEDRILVFCLYKKEATRIEGFLRSRGGCRVAGIHGDLSQAQRTQALAQFKSGACPLLIATDVAARGLDIPAVKLVINVTFPLTIEDYVHRIGRTGRAGAMGMAYTFFTDHDKALSGSLVNILKAAKQPVPEELMKFGTTVKKKEHSAYGAFFKDNAE